MTENKEKKYSPWMPITDIKALRVLGKAVEETAELNKALARAIIQGLDGIDPHTGKDNRTAILEEMADVEANISLLKDFFGFHRMLLHEYNPEINNYYLRIMNKAEKLKEWQEGDLDE